MLGGYDDFYASMATYLSVESMGLTDKDFSKSVIAEGWDKKYLIIPAESDGLTVLWPDAALTKKIVSIRSDEKKRGELDKIIGSLFINKLITNASDFEGAEAKNGVKITGTAVVKDTKVKFSTGAQATLNTAIKAIDKISYGSTLQENRRKFAIWELTGGFPQEVIKHGSFDRASSDDQEFNEKIASVLKGAIKDDIQNIENLCGKLVAKLYSELLNEGNKSTLNCLIQGVPVAELLVIINSSLFSTDEVRSILSNDKEPESSYVEVYDKSKTGECVAAGSANVPRFSENSEVYDFYHQVSKTGNYKDIPIICDELKGLYYPLRAFYSDIKRLTESCKNAKQGKETDKIVYNIMFVNACFNSRGSGNNGLPAGLYGEGVDSNNPGIQATITVLHKHFEDVFLDKHGKTLPREIFGSSESRPVDDTIVKLSRLSETQLKKILTDPRAEKFVSVLKTSL